MTELTLKRIEENKSTRSPYLELSDGDLKDIPIQVTELVWLEELIIKFGFNTEIPPFPEDFGNLNKLTRLTLGGTQMKTFISKVSGNSLSQVAKLVNLRLLRINFLEMPDLSFLADLKNLQLLSFQANKIQDISSLPQLNNLLELHINYSDVSDLAPLSAVPNLQILHLKKNQVSDINPVSKLKGLRHLNFDTNHVRDITPLSGLTNLETASFNLNDVIDISPLSGLKNLYEIHFGKNKVTALKPLLSLQLLIRFNSVGCPVKDCPSDVCESGDPKQLRAYFAAHEKQHAESLAKGAVPMGSEHFEKNGNSLPSTGSSRLDTRRDVKLIILGNSNTGKTNLVEFLKSNTCLGKRRSTHGMEVHRWIPDAKRFPILKNIAVSTWDFGGQEYYHGAYRLFLSANAVYVLLWCKESNVNGRRKTRLADDGPELDLEHFEIKYWLDTIRHYSSGKENVPLLLVQNKTDDPDVDKIRISQELHKDYNIRDSFHISLVKGADDKFPRQCNTLSNFLSELQFVIEGSADKAPIPQHWQQIRNEILLLKNKKRPNHFSKYIEMGLQISLTKFEEACNSLIGSKLTEDELHTLPRWLDRGGAIVFFPDIPELKDQLFVTPSLLAEKIYKILNDQVYQRGGSFMIEEIFDKDDKELKKIFLEIAQHLQLIFPHPVKGKEKYYLAPQYLPDSHPVEDLFRIASRGAWQSSFWVKVPLFHYKKILHGLLISFASDPLTDCSYFWKHGIMFLKNDLRVLIKGLYPEEHEYDGTILIGVEKDNQKQPALQNEIFKKILDLLKTNISHSPSLNDTSVVAGKPGRINDETESEITNPMSNIKLLISYDGINYVRFSSLMENPGEHKIKAENNNTWLITRHFAPLLPFTPSDAKRVFLSYSHRNAAWLGRLRVHLAGLRRSKEIETWDDKEILPGDTWDATIKSNLEEADIIILLLSADFFDSDYIWNKELSIAYRKFNDKSATVIPVLLEPVDLDSIPVFQSTENGQPYRITDFQIIPNHNDRGLLAVSLWQNQEEALATVAERIREAIKMQRGVLSEL